MSLVSFLNTGHTLAISQSVGRVPVSIDWVKITCNIGDISLQQCFKINGEILSGPLALLKSNKDN